MSTKKRNGPSPEVSAAAAALGRLGGLSRSPAKVAAVRENGRKGGRPRKRPEERKQARGGGA